MIEKHPFLLSPSFFQRWNRKFDHVPFITSERPVGIRERKKILDGLISLRTSYRIARVRISVSERGRDIFSLSPQSFVFFLGVRLVSNGGTREE